MTRELWPRQLGELRGLFEQELSSLLPEPHGPSAELLEAMRYACESGKRIRPQLCLASAAACGGAPEPAMLPAVAVELIHCYSLVHDDLPVMDDDNERRGRPTVHVRFGQAQALLAGDALLTEAFAVLSDSRLVHELALAAGWRGMVGGQSEELLAPASSGLASARRIAQLKTGQLMRAACRMGAIAAGAREDHLAAITRFGELYGLAYQVIDDLADRERDLELGRTLNVAILLGPASATTMAQCSLNQARAQLAGVEWPGDCGLLAQLVDALAAAR